MMMATCKRCKKPITGNYVTALGEPWHSQCFVCAGCKKSISDQEFLSFSGLPYHSHCLRCQGCGLSITANYVKHNHFPWHPRCYKHQSHPPCSICRKPLTRRYLVDFWGNAYCHTHKDFARCASCGRIVCDHLTSGGMQYPDGLLICTTCGLYGVATVERANNIVNEMRKALASVGLKLNRAQVPVHLCGRDDLRKFSRHNFHDERPILGLARWTIMSSGKRVVARNFKDILIQTNLPEEHFRTVAIHELTHAWFFYNNYQDLPIKVEEGMCMLMEYIWLRSQKTQDARYRRTILMKSSDPIYGEGFREARAALKLMPLNILLAFLKEKKKFPTRLAAFFYC
ncbi:protein DA1 [Candidatus Sororendozoicomonas aggregata]|uniref:protein DA1 n=1 Tax=Candidatus Sororendozoicomonas aggregata TaxID=3073239 RepID=UPI002ED3ED38